MQERTTPAETQWIAELWCGAEFLEETATSAEVVVAAVERASIGGVVVHPQDQDFPRFHLDRLAPFGYIVQAWEDEASWSDFLVTAVEFGPPSVEVELGGQGVELWPSQLLVGRGLVESALGYFLKSGKLLRELSWVRIDQFPRRDISDRAPQEPANGPSPLQPQRAS